MIGIQFHPEATLQDVEGLDKEGNTKIIQQFIELSKVLQVKERLHMELFNLR